MNAASRSVETGTDSKAGLHATFPLARRGGYDSDAVDAWVRNLATELSGAADHVKTLEDENSSLRELVNQLKERVASIDKPSYSGLGGHAAQLLQLAEQEAADVRVRATRESDELMKRAEKEASLLRTAAADDAGELRTRAVAELEDHRRNLLGNALAHLVERLESDESANHEGQTTGHSDTSIDGVLQARALTELIDLYRVRSVLRASQHGYSQRRLAKLLGTSQTDIHRILRRARAMPETVSESPRELILKFLAGMISRGRLLGLLSETERGHVAPGNQEDGYQPGAWDEIRTAHLDGLIGEDLYEELRGQGFTSSRRKSDRA